MQSTAGLVQLDRALAVYDGVRGDNELAVDITDPHGVFTGSVRATFTGLGGFEGFSEAEQALFTLAIGLIGGQAAMSQEIVLHTRIERSILPAALDLARLLYDAHAYAQRLEAWPTPGFPSLAYPSSSERRSFRSETGVPRSTTRCVLLWSGGKDALASLRVLRANGFDVVGLHATANEAVAALEQSAAVDLAAANDLPLVTMTLEWTVVARILNYWSTSSNRFPLVNPVPHGRDLALIIASVGVARTMGAAYITAGYEYDLWSRRIQYGGRTIFRHDVQSRRAAELINLALRPVSGLRFFSPIAAFRERTIMAYLLRNDSEAWRTIVSCFWSNWCGVCTKCLRYALTQEAIEVRRIRFQANPLTDKNPALGALVSSIEDESTPFWEQQVVNLYSVLDAGGLGHAPLAQEALSRKRELLQPRLSALKAELDRVQPDDLAPTDFNWTLDEGDPKAPEAIGAG